MTGGWGTHLPFCCAGDARLIRDDRVIRSSHRIRTRRLTLRPLGLRDAARIAELAGDWDIARMTARIPYPYSVRLAEEWIAEINDTECVLGIVHRFRLIGCCGYVPDEQSADIGYWIGKPWWGRGFATEAARALIDHCFDRGFERVTCGHFADNPASGRVIAKLGFIAVGRERLWCEARGEHVETLRYELLNQPRSRMKSGS
jgi:ribosomal-protein-alanine N-acetyltransferase